MLIVKTSHPIEPTLFVYKLSNIKDIFSDLNYRISAHRLRTLASIIITRDKRCDFKFTTIELLFGAVYEHM